jgi:hypothetical protein
MRPCPDTPFPRWPSFGSSFRCDTLPSVYQHPEMPSEVEMSNSSQSSGEPTILPAYKQGSLAIPAECERVFSSTKKLLAPERSRPAPDIIDASECLKNWWDRRLIEQLEDEWEISDGSRGNKDRFCILHSQFHILIYQYLVPNVSFSFIA